MNPRSFLDQKEKEITNSRSLRTFAPPAPTSTMDRLSDDLLRHILSFASSKEAASTSALSRRWRWIWHSTGAINLETRIPSLSDHPKVSAFHEHEDRFSSHRAAFVSAAEKTLDAAAAFPVTRLTLRVEADNPNDIWMYIHGRDRGRIDSKSLDVVAKLLLHPAARCVEELVLAPGNACRSLDDDFEVMSTKTQFYGHNLGSVLPETLRALDVTGCSEFTPPGAGALPRLALLRLILCFVHVTQLQGVIDAAPALTSVHLDSVYLYAEKEDSLPPSPEEALPVCLRFPSATAIILEKCTWLEDPTYHSSRTSLEIDAPRLRRFTYKGLIRQISLSSPALDFDRVDLHFLPDTSYSYPGDKVPWCETFWRLLRNFTSAKELKVRVNHLEDIAVLTAARQAELLCTFRNLERLEVEGEHRPKGKTAAVAIGNLLRCCPVVVDLRIKLNTAQSDSTRYCQYGKLLLERKHQSDFNRSMDSFKRRRSEPTFYLGDDDDAKYDEVSDIPGLSSRIFHCLQSSVRRVGLQFQLEETNCLGLRLIKFLAENALVLEEMRIDGGNRKMCEHMNFEIERWIAKKRKTSFRVLPLER